MLPLSILAQENSIQIFDLGGDELSFSLNSGGNKCEKTLPQKCILG